MVGKAGTDASQNPFTKAAEEGFNQSAVRPPTIPLVTNGKPLLLAGSKSPQAYSSKPHLSIEVPVNGHSRRVNGLKQPSSDTAAMNQKGPSVTFSYSGAEKLNHP